MGQAIRVGWEWEPRSRVAHLDRVPSRIARQLLVFFWHLRGLRRPPGSGLRDQHPFVLTGSRPSHAGGPSRRSLTNRAELVTARRMQTEL